MTTIPNFDPLLVKLESFEGPLDILLHLIQKKKLDIHSLSLATLCVPFLSYVKNTTQIQLENSSQFIYIASRLIAIKARSLLPNPTDEEEDDTQTEEALRQQLLEYKKFKEAGEVLAQMNWLQRDHFTRSEKIQMEVIKEIDTSDEQLIRISIAKLLLVYEQVLQKSRDLSEEFQLPEVKISTQEILQQIITELEQKGSFMLQKFLIQLENIESKIISFILLLEIARLQWIRMEQECHLGKIYCYSTQKFSENKNRKLVFSDFPQ